MTSYPHVMSEVETLQAVCGGASLARYGDGEFKLCRGGAIKSQPANDALARRLRGILSDSGACLVGLPNLHSPTPKAAHWANYRGVAGLLSDRPYASAFVSRPDSAPWIDTDAYWAQMASLWEGQAVTLVRGSGKSLTSARLSSATSVTEILCPASDAWSVYDQLLEQIGTPARALLCCGPTATVMAVDLCAKGVHAVDLGHAGMFLHRFQDRQRVAC